MALSAHAIAALILTAVALLLFTRDRLRLEYSCLAVLVVLVTMFEVFPYTGPELTLRGTRFMQGFGNEALITICLLLVLAKGVETSGALRPLGRVLARLWLWNRTLALLVTLLVAAFASAFFNNTPIVVLLLPILVGVARRVNLSPSRILLPVGFATIIGGMATTIGTSTNLLVVSVAAEYGVPRFGMFDFVLPVIFGGSVGILFLWMVAPRLLPDRPTPLAGSVPRIFDSVIELTDASGFAGKTLADVRQLVEGQIHIVRVVRNNLEIVRLPALRLQAGDRLHVRGTPEAIKRIQHSFGGAFDPEGPHRAPDQQLAEIVVTQDYPLHGKALSELEGVVLHGLTLVGVYRPGRRKMTPVMESSDPVLHSGDVLLIQGKRRQIQELKSSHEFLIIDRTIHVPRSEKAPLALAIMAAVILSAALGWLPILVSAVCGAALMLAGRCLAWEEAWSAIDTRLVLVIVTALGLGTALEATGAADFLAQQYVSAFRNLPPPVILSGLLLITALLTEVVTNNAVAVIATPIAIEIANELGLPAVPFVLAVLFGANMSYMTPIGYQTNLLVFSAGGYRFSDFFRTGVPLQLLLWLAFSFVLGVMYL